MIVNVTHRKKYFFAITYTGGGNNITCTRVKNEKEMKMTLNIHSEKSYKTLSSN